MLSGIRSGIGTSSGIGARSDTGAACHMPDRIDCCQHLIHRQVPQAIQSLNPAVL
jgi:hypothetical protein